MRKSLMYRVIISVLFLFSFLTNRAQGNKIALVIAVGDYPNETGWKPISSANDIPLIKGALVAQGFSEENITIVKDNEASKEGILKAFNNLIDQLAEGDIVVIHYSGHGQQITDNNGDEIDGYDEAIVPIDAHARFKKGIYEGENHIRDDQIGVLLTKIRRLVGPNGSVLLIMDSCHSGTSSRGLSKSRGTQETFNTSDPINDVEVVKESGLFGLGDDEDMEIEMAPLICFYGASAHELNYETKDANGQGVGSLSYAFSDAFTNAAATQSYQELFDQIKIRMSVLAPRQSPQAEGDLGKGILGGNIEGKKTYYKVMQVHDGQAATINGGNLMGIFEGSEVAFYPLGEEITDDNLVVNGKVTYVDATSADVEFGKQINNFPDCKAVVTKVNYGSIAVSVEMNIASDALKNALLKEFKKYPLISLVDENADLLLEENNEFTRGNNVQLLTTQEYELLNKSIDDADQTAIKIVEKVLSYAQAKYLRKIEMYNEDLDLNFEFIPIKAKQVGRGRWMEESRGTITDKEDESGNIVFETGDFFKIKVTNDGYEVAYFSILDFQPDNVINVLIPGKYQKAADYVLQPGEAVELPKVFRFSPPTGTEVFKLIASSEPIEFRSILKNQGAHRGEETESNNPFAQLVSSSFRSETGTRGTETMSVSPGNCNIHSITFSIIDKK